MAISSAETQKYSFYRAIRRGYPHFSYFTAISALFMANLALFGLDLGLFVGGFLVYYDIFDDFIFIHKHR
jgi:hypothetical protein